MILKNTPVSCKMFLFLTDGRKIYKMCLLFKYILLCILASEYCMFFFYSIAFDYNFVVNVKTGGFVSGPVEEIAVLIALLRDNRAGLATYRPEQEERP